MAHAITGKAGYVICRAQYEMKMWDLLFKKQVKHSIKGPKIQTLFFPPQFLSYPVMVFLIFLFSIRSEKN